MTCRECELALGDELESLAVEAHLANCRDCSLLAEAIRANLTACATLACEEMPAVRLGVTARIGAKARTRKLLRWGWALAAAALIAMIWFRRPEENFAPPPRRFAVTPPKIEIPAATRAPKKKAAPLMVKMLTDDPNVVIYWQVETKEGTEQ